jgi:putative hemolysin
LGKVTGNQRKFEFSKSRTTERRKKMKRIFTFTIILMALTACTALQVQTLEPAATDMPQVRISNPASVFCEQNGNKLEIRTADDGSQSGVCVFPDGNTCEEWAFYRGECGPAAQDGTSPAVTVEATKEASAGGPSRLVSQARYTAPNPPCPSSLTMR